MPSLSERTSNKKDAFKFLSGLEKHLNSSLLSAKEIRQGVRSIVKQAQTNKSMQHKRWPEDAFLHHFAIPEIFEHMKSVKGIGDEKARQSLLSEGFQNMKEFCLSTPARRMGHPFNKIIGTVPAQIMARWKGKSKGSKLTQSCPDFAFTEPFPFKVVFEGKYFEKGSNAKAEKDLVTNIYQSFFYRALPFVEKQKNRPAWDYDYSCLLACDASKEGTLKAAWDGLDEEVRKGFWDGANVYVMILRKE